MVLGSVSPDYLFRQRSCCREQRRSSTAMSDLSLVIKRILDLAGAILGLAVFGLPMAILAGLIRHRMGSPVLYRVIRPGLHAQPFLLYKFRTMRDLVDAAGRSLSDKERITPLGR